MDANLEATLLACTMPDTATIRQAEESLQKQLKGKSSVGKLVHAIHGSTHVGVRQLAAVLLRLKLNMHWIKLNPQEQDFCKRALLESLGREQVRPVRLAVCYAISSLARHQFIGGPQGWPELMQMLNNATQDATNVEHREVGFLLMYALTETIGTSLKVILPDVARTLSQALQSESDPRVYSVVMRSSAALIEFLSEEEEVMLFQPLLQPLLEALSRGNFAQDEFTVQSIVQVVEVISSLSESPLPVLDPFIVPACTVLGALVSSRTIDDAIRSASATALSEVISSKTRLVSKNLQSRGAALQACIDLARETAEDDAENGGNDDEDGAGADEMSLKSMTEMLITAYASCLPNKLVVDTLLNSAAGLIGNQQDQIGREAGLIILIVASESIATELVESHASSFDQLVGMVMDCVTRAGQAPGVTRHALLLLSHWAEFLWPLMDVHAPVVIPAAIQLALTYHDRIFPEANMVLQQYCGAMDEDEVAPYVDDICNVAMGLFDGDKRRTPKLVRSAIETLSYVSVAAGARFAPHFDRCMRIVSPLMGLVGEEYSEVRAHSTALMGQLAVVSTKCTPPGAANPFLQFVPELVNACLQGLEREDIADLDYRDSVHHLFGNVAIAVGVQFEQFVPVVVPILLGDCVADDDDVVQRVVDRDGLNKAPDMLKTIAQEDDVADDSEGDDDNDDGNVKVLTSVREAAADSKASAFSALDTICEVYALAENVNQETLARSALMGFIENIIETCMKTIDEYLHPQVRANAVGALGSVILFAYKAELPTPVARPSQAEVLAFANTSLKDSDLDIQWLPGRSLAQHVPRTMRLVDEFVLPYLLEAMTSDTSKVVAAKACTTVEQLAARIGPTIFSTEPASTVDSVLTLLHGHGASQKQDDRLGRARRGEEDEGGDDDEDEEEDEERRHDEILMDAMVEALANLSRAFGRDNLLPFLPRMLPPLVKRSRPRMPLRDRVSCVGCLSQVLAVAGSYPQQLSSKLAQCAIEAVKQNEDSCLRRNGLVLCAVLVESGNAQLPLGQVLMVLKPVFEEHSKSSEKQRKWEVEDDLAVLDNACSLIARILKRPDLDAELRLRVLAEFLQYLPLRYDHEEDWVVYSALLPIAESIQDMQVLQQMLSVCLRAADDIEGKGSFITFARLCKTILARIGQPHPELEQKLETKRAALNI